MVDGKIDPESPPDIALADEVVERYHEARDVQAAYVQQAGEREHPDWFDVLVETEPLREAAQRVHTTGYRINPEMDEPGYLSPRKICPNARVWMSACSSPVTRRRSRPGGCRVDRCLVDRVRGLSVKIVPLSNTSGKQLIAHGLTLIDLHIKGHYCR